MIMRVYMQDAHVFKSIVCLWFLFAEYLSGKFSFQNNL